MVNRADLDYYLLQKSEADVVEGVAVTGVEEMADRVRTQINRLRPARFAAWFFYNYAGFSFLCVERSPALTSLFLQLPAGSITYRQLIPRLPLYLARSVARGRRG